MNQLVVDRFLEAKISKYFAKLQKVIPILTLISFIESDILDALNFLLIRFVDIATVQLSFFVNCPPHDEVEPTLKKTHHRNGI